MATNKTSYDAVRKAAELITEKRLKAFVESLESNLPLVNNQIQWGKLKGMEFPATVIDNWLQRARDAGLLDVNLNRAAFEVWKRLEELGVKITGQEKCQIVPDWDIESKLARAIEKGFAKSKPR